jgi:hypothetical protein
MEEEFLSVDSSAKLIEVARTFPEATLASAIALLATAGCGGQASDGAGGMSGSGGTQAGGAASGASAGASSDCDPPAFEDAVVELVVRDRALALSEDGEMTPEILSQIRSASFTGVTSLAGIECLVNLSELNLRESASLSNLSPVQALEQLVFLRLEGSGVSDLGALSSLTKLEFLTVEDSPVSSLEPLTSGSSLRTLILDRTRVTDLSPLSSHLSLQHLSFLATRVSSVEPLRDLLELDAIYFSGTAVPDLAPLVKPLPGGGCPEIHPGGGLSRASIDIHIPALCDLGWSVIGYCGLACSYK